MKNKRIITGVFLGGLILFTALFFDIFANKLISSISLFFVGEQEVVIRISDKMVDGRDVNILSEGSPNEYFEMLKTASDSDSAWTFIKGETGVSWTRLVSSVKGAEIRITDKVSPDKYITALQGPGGGLLEVQADGETKKYDLNRKSDDEVIRIYPFKEMNCASAIRWSLHILLFVILAVALAYIAHFVYAKGFWDSKKICTYVYLGLISLLFIGCFKDTVNDIIVNKLLPKEVVSFSVSGYTDMRIGTGDFRNALSGENQMVAHIEEDGVYTASFLVTRVPEQYVAVTLSDEIKEVVYEVNGVKYQYKVSDDDKTTGFCKIYPFADSTLKVLYSILIYAIGSCLVWIWLVLLHNYLRRKGCVGKVFKIEYQKPLLFFVIILGATFAIAAFQYSFKIDLPYYIPDNAVGDQGGYWNTYIFKDGFFDFDVLAETAPFRGYTNFLLSSISKVIGSRLSIDPVMIYLLFPALAFAWFLAYILPQFYEHFMGRRARYISIVGFAVVFIYYYRAWITMCTMDFFTMTLFFGTIVYAIKAYKEETIRHAVVAGVAFSLMINMHYNYGLYMLIIIILYPLCILCKRRMPSEKVSFYSIWTMLKNNFTRKRVIAFMVAASCFLVVCIPQSVVNYKNDYYGLFPHDSEKAYGGHPVSWSMWNAFFTHGMILWPKFIGDNQTTSMKEQLYENRGELLHPAQAMDVYAESPVETAVTLVKKTFAMFDYKSNVNYGTEITWRETTGLLFSFFNYLLLLVGLFVLVKQRRSIPWRMRLICWLVFVTSVATSLAGHVEQRASMAFCVVLYMMATYIFCGEIITNKDKYKAYIKNGLLKFIFFGEIFCFTISMALWA